MLDRTVCIVGAASGRGAPDSGCESGPEALRRSTLSTQLWRAGLDPTWDAILPAEARNPTRQKPYARCARVCRSAYVASLNAAPSRSFLAGTTPAP